MFKAKKKQGIIAYTGIPTIYRISMENFKLCFCMFIGIQLSYSLSNSILWLQEGSQNKDKNTKVIYFSWPNKLPCKYWKSRNHNFSKLEGTTSYLVFITIALFFPFAFVLSPKYYMNRYSLTWLVEYCTMKITAILIHKYRLYRSIFAMYQAQFCCFPIAYVVLRHIMLYNSLGRE